MHRASSNSNHVFVYISFIQSKQTSAVLAWPLFVILAAPKRAQHGSLIKLCSMLHTFFTFGFIEMALHCEYQTSSLTEMLDATEAGNTAHSYTRPNIGFTEKLATIACSKPHESMLQS